MSRADGKEFIGSRLSEASILIKTTGLRAVLNHSAGGIGRNRLNVDTAAEGGEASRAQKHVSSRPADHGRHRTSQNTLCQRSRQPYVCLYGRVALYVVLVAAWRGRP